MHAAYLAANHVFAVLGGRLSFGTLLYRGPATVVLQQHIDDDEQRDDK
jgi:hypothetical protein